MGLSNLFPSLTQSLQKNVLFAENPRPSPVEERTAPDLTPKTALADNSRSRSRHPAKAILAGGISGAIEISLTYPTEYLKTQLQLNKSLAKKGLFSAARSTFREHSVFGFYRGLSCLLFFSVPKNASRFFAYEKLKKLLEDEGGRLSVPRTLLCGLGSGMFEALLVVTPMETLKVKLIHDQLQNSAGGRKYRNFFHGVCRIVSEQGLSATYRGLSATLLKQGSNQAIRWLVYSRAKQLFAGSGSPAEIGTLKTMLAGALAGAASVYGNTPLDVIKTRLQGLQAHRYNGFVDCARQIWRQEGLPAFYKGVTPRLMRVCADVAIVMVVYEQVMKVFDRVWVTD